MSKARPPRTHRDSDAFKAKAVCLSDLPNVLIQDVAAALDIHPFLLSRWRKQAREGLFVTMGVKLDLESVAELKRLRELEKTYKLIQEEHELLKKGHPVCFLKPSQQLARWRLTIQSTRTCAIGALRRSHSPVTSNVEINDSQAP